MSTPAEESNQNTTHQPLGGVVAHGAVVDQFAAYPFATDEEFQQGLSGIIASAALEGKSEEERAEILLRSEVFYFNRRTGSSLTMEDARRARQRNLREAVPPHDRVTVNPSTTATLNGREEEPQMLSFAQLKALIEQGRTDEIPNNKVIPNVLSSESPSESRAPPRKKPWEVSASA